MKKNLKLSFIFLLIIAVSSMISCQGSNIAFDAMERAAYTFSLVNNTEGHIRDLDILTEDGTISHPCGKMNPNDICVQRFTRKPDVLRIVYKADPVMGLGMKFDHDNVEEIWKFHRPANGRTETYNLALDEDYFSMSASNLSGSDDLFLDGFGFNNSGNPNDIKDYEYISKYFNTTDEVVEFFIVEIDATLNHKNITPGTYALYADDDGDPLTPVVLLGSDDSMGNVIGPGIVSGTIDYANGKIIISMAEEPMGKVTCSYHAPLAINEGSANRAWLGFYKKSDLNEIIQNVFILQRNSFGAIQGYWSFNIEHDEDSSDLKQNIFGTYVLDFICTEEDFNERK